MSEDGRFETMRTDRASILNLSRQHRRLHERRTRTETPIRRCRDVAFELVLRCGCVEGSDDLS